MSLHDGLSLARVSDMMFCSLKKECVSLKGIPFSYASTSVEKISKPKDVEKDGGDGRCNFEYKLNTRL